MFDIASTRQDWVTVESLAIDTASARATDYTTIDCLSGNVVPSITADESPVR